MPHNKSINKRDKNEFKEMNTTIKDAVSRVHNVALISSFGPVINLQNLVNPYYVFCYQWLLRPKKPLIMSKPRCCCYTLVIYIET